LEIAATDSSAGAGSEQGSGVATSGASASAVASKDLDPDEPRTKALYILKRKRSQYEKAAATLRKHRLRLQKTVVAQSKPDQRLRELRAQWRLVAPEHGTRALPHAARATEVVAADVDVYNRTSADASFRLGRLVSRVPRYATIELQDDCNLSHDMKVWEDEHGLLCQSDAYSPDESSLTKELENVHAKESESKEENSHFPTRAEPFTIADPAQGKLDTHFDPKTVVMMTLRFDIEKNSTGFCQSACLEPMSSSGSVVGRNRADEDFLIALQHSLFCAKLFESIRREVAPDTEDIGKVRTSAKAQSSVWISSEAEENFLPPISQMITNRIGEDLAPLCVVHIHEGDLRVLLDCEYSLRIRIVEAQSVESDANKINNIQSEDVRKSLESGSQSSEQLLLLCRALLLHAQETWHVFSAETEKLQEQQKSLAHDQLSTTTTTSTQKPVLKNPRVLQSCVSLGAKMLFERRICSLLEKLKDWLKLTFQKDGSEAFHVEWLPLSMFDLCAQFTMSYGSWSIDANIVCDELTVTQFGDRGDYRKAKFYSAEDFEIFLKLAIKRHSKPCASICTDLTC
jgi:hypothetical protein